MEKNVVNGTLVELDMDAHTCGRLGQSSTHRHRAWWVFPELKQRQPRRGSACEDPASMGYVVASMSYRLFGRFGLEAALSGTLTTSQGSLEGV